VRNRRVPLAAALCVCALLWSSGCGASGPRREYTKGDQRLAAAIALRVSDLAPDWRPDPSIAHADVPRHCYDEVWRHLVITGETATGFFEGPREFPTGPNYASSYVVVFASRGTAISALIRLRKAPSLRCLATDFKSHLPDKPKIEHVAIRPLSLPALGDRSTAAELAIDLPASGFIPRGYVDVVLVQRGRVFSLLLFGDVGYPFDPAVERQVSRAVAARS
jgi:hypothetical protein